MNNENLKEDKLYEIFENGQKLRAEIADFYRLVADYGRLGGYDETYETMREHVLAVSEHLRKTVGATILA